MSKKTQEKETKNYDLIKVKFIKFLADPLRCETQGEFAKREGVNQVTLSDWKKNPEFRKDLQRELESHLIDDIGEVYEIIKKRAKKGDSYFVNLYLKQLEMLKAEKQEVEQKADGTLKELVEYLKTDEKKPAVDSKVDTAKKEPDSKEVGEKSEQGNIDSEAQKSQG